MIRQSYFRRMDTHLAKVGDFSFLEEKNGYYRIKEYVGIYQGKMLTITWNDYQCSTVDDCKHTVERVLKTRLMEQPDGD